MVEETAVDMGEVAAKNGFAIVLDGHGINHAVSSRSGVEGGKGVAGIIRVPFAIQRAGWGIVIHDRDRGEIVRPEKGGAGWRVQSDDDFFVEFDGVIFRVNYLK